jgi:hypothetical protein
MKPPKLGFQQKLIRWLFFNNVIFFNRRRDNFRDSNPSQKKKIHLEVRVPSNIDTALVWSGNGKINFFKSMPSINE